MSRSEFTPTDVDAEAHVVATLLTTPDKFLDVADKLLPEDFGTPQLAQIFTAILNCDAAGQPFDQVTVAAELRRMKQLSNAGGKEALERLVGRSVEVGNVHAHVNIVREKSLLRRSMEAGRAITSAALDPAAKADEVVEEAEQAVFKLGQRESGGGMVGMPQAVASMNAEMARVRSGQMLGVPTGFPELDKLTSGLQSGQLVLIGGRPGSGKSAIALQMARHMAETTGQMVPFLSYEMSTNELTFRMLASAIEHPLQDLRSGKIHTGRDRDIGTEVARMAQLPLMIDDSPPQSITGIRSAMRRLARRGPIAGIFVDYLQLLRGESRTDNRVQELSEISRGLKMLASELGVPVVSGSQLSRGAVGGPGGGSVKPALHHLRDSGSLEQDASVVMLVHRPFAAGDTGVSPKEATLILAKQRNGPAGIDIPIDFEPEWASFVPSTRRVSEPPQPPPPGRPRQAGDLF